MTTTWTNPETGKPMTVYVHGPEFLERYGETYLLVNKGEVRTPYTFFVRIPHTDVVMA